MLAAAVVFGASYLLAKLLTDQTNAVIVVGMLSFWVTLGLAPMAAHVWVTPDLHTVLVLFVVACLATAGHYTMTLAFRSAPLTVTQPVTFLQLVWAVSVGTLFFGEAVDIWVVIGGLVILASVSFMTWREAMLKRQITPAVPETKL
jgi:drug/metabolite transporter (DMT)-like permease